MHCFKKTFKISVTLSLSLALFVCLSSPQDRTEFHISTFQDMPHPECVLEPQWGSALLPGDTHFKTRLVLSTTLFWSSYLPERIFNSNPGFYFQKNIFSSPLLHLKTSFLQWVWHIQKKVKRLHAHLNNWSQNEQQGHRHPEASPALSPALPTPRATGSHLSWYPLSAFSWRF